MLRVRGPRRPTAGSAAIGALLAGLVAVAAPSPAQTPRPGDAASAVPACTHCRERLKTVDALRASLPAAWSVRSEPEPVLGGEMLVVRAGPRDGPRLLLVHGLGQNGFTDWMPVLPQLAKRWRVTAVDLPGFGYSSSPVAKLSPTNYARVLAQLIERDGGGPVDIVGHSMGGAVALRLAHEQPQRVGRLVLVDAAGILHRTAFTKHVASVPISVEGMPEPLKEPIARLRDLGNILVERLFGMPGDPTRVLREREPLWALALRDKVNINAALALVDEDFSAAVHTVAAPVQIIWGEADPIAPLRTGQLLARRLPRAQLATLPGIGHVPMDQATHDFLGLLTRALQNDPAPRQTAASTDEALADLECKGQVDRRYSGRYREVRIDGCSAVRLTDVVADRIVIRDSIVQMLGVQVRSDDIALDVTNSELVATASDFIGKLGIRSDASRVDLAGVRVEAGGFGVQALRSSRFVASVSELRDAFHRGWWHDDRTLENGLLDLSAPAPAPGAASSPRS